MIKNFTAAECLIEEWQSWVEVQPLADCPFILYIFGDILWDGKSPKPQLRKLENKRIPEEHLYLEISAMQPSHSNKVIELTYSECLTNPVVYSDIFITSGSEILVHINQIELSVHQ